MFNPVEEQTFSESAQAEAPQIKPRTGLSHVALVASFPPRRCGIATFTADVHAQLIASASGLRCDVVAMAEPDADEPIEGARVIIRQDERADYVHAARKLNADGVELVCVQHEFGIFGGDAGDYLLDFLDELECPVVTALHTVLEEPNDDQRRVMATLLRRSTRLIVMSERGRRILIERYNAIPEKIEMIPHGAPDYALIDPDKVKSRFGLAGRKVLLTFGLLSPNKGIESVIRALPDVIAAHPDTLYVILGATHPHLKRREGEAYRERLMALAEEQGVADHIRFVNAYVSTEELLGYLAAADIYVTPYLHEAQVTSGTLSYAVALGKPVVSTPYWHAQELLADNVGKLVGFNDSNAICAALCELLSDPAKREDYRRRAYAKGRETVWPRVGVRYLQTFATAVRQARKAGERRRVLVEPPNLRAVERMTDACGMLQHSRFSVPDRMHGYCVDDNARALLLMVRGRAAGIRGANAERLTAIYAAFVNHAWNGDNGRFRNFMSYDRHWLEDAGSEDSFGRSLWALGETAKLARDRDLAGWAAHLGSAVIPHVATIEHHRALAFSCLGLSALVASDNDAFRGNSAARAMLARASGVLYEAFQRESKSGWVWLEPHLSYDNARLAEALIVAGRTLQRPAMRDAGLSALGWLTAQQTGQGGVFRPVGNACFGEPYCHPAPFDQQPVEALATIDACWAAFDASGDPIWEEEAARAYSWFFGKNERGLSLAAPNGGCYDGIWESGLNRNQGAESILALQLSNCAMKSRDRSHRLSAAR